MRFPPSLLDEIRARLPVSAVVGRKVRLRKAGREWKGLSPFNAEKTPSFYVNDQKGFYHCFSSGRHGDIFTFLMETEGLSFPEAVERLAAEAGVALPASSPEAARDEVRRRGLLEVVEMGARFFEAELARRDGAEARRYLDGRGIAPETRREFRLGYAPAARTALRDHLAAKGVPIAAMLAAGLIVQPDDGREPYDRFRDRVVFPIQDGKGRVVGFGGRALKPDIQPKYLNSPEGPVFDKSRLVFNLHRARGALAANRDATALVVEGYLDAISASQAGIGPVVATLGTAFTGDQIALLWRLAPEPVICFDGDRAGRDAAFRALERILPELRAGFAFRFAFLPEGQDPDDLVRAAGAAGLEGAITGARTIWDTIWARELGRARLDSENGQALFEREILGLVRLIPDPLLRRRYEERARAEIREHLWQLTRARIRGTPDRAANNARKYAAPPPPPIPPPSAESGREALILSLLAAHRWLLDEVVDEVAETEFTGPVAREVAAALVTERAVPADGLARLHDRLLPPDRKRLRPDADRADLRETLRQALLLQDRARRLAAEIREAAAEAAGDGDERAGAVLQELKAREASTLGLEAMRGD